MAKHKFRADSSHFKEQVTFLKLYLLAVCLALIIPRFTLF